MNTLYASVLVLVAAPLPPVPELVDTTWTYLVWEIQFHGNGTYDEYVNEIRTAHGKWTLRGRRLRMAQEYGDIREEFTIGGCTKWRMGVIWRQLPGGMPRPRTIMERIR